MLLGHGHERLDGLVGVVGLDGLVRVRVGVRVRVRVRVRVKVKVRVRVESGSGLGLGLSKSATTAPMSALSESGSPREPCRR